MRGITIVVRFWHEPDSVSLDALQLNMQLFIRLP